MNNFKFLSFLLSLILIVSCGLTSTSLAQEQSTEAQKKQKPFTFRVSLRGEYDDNIYTRAKDKESSWKAVIQPTFLFNGKKDKVSYSARYTPTVYYFFDRLGDSPWDFAHEVSGFFKYSISPRFALTFQDVFRYQQDPELTNGTGINYNLIRRNGNYFSNAFSIGLMANWTRQLSTRSDYTNIFYDYSDKTLEKIVDYMAHKFSHDFLWTLTQKTQLVLGGIYTITDYNFARRDYNNFLIQAGADFQITPNLTAGVRGGYTFNQFVSSIRDEQGGYDNYFENWEAGEIYANVFSSWQLGSKSNVGFSYSHSEIPTDNGNYFFRVADTFTVNGKYKVTPKLSGRGMVYYTLGRYDKDYSLKTNTSIDDEFSENILGLDLGLVYALVKDKISFECGYNYTEVINASIDAREYDRNRFYVGLRGTY